MNKRQRKKHFKKFYTMDLAKDWCDKTMLSTYSMNGGKLSTSIQEITANMMERKRRLDWIKLNRAFNMNLISLDRRKLFEDLQV